MRIVGRTLAIICWVGPLVWLAWTGKWAAFVISVPITAAIVVMAVRSTRKREVA